jgi:hypothetical protein
MVVEIVVGNGFLPDILYYGQVTALQAKLSVNSGCKMDPFETAA